jgi:hypothetical protein
LFTASLLLLGVDKPVMLPPVIDTDAEFCVAIEPNPKFVLDVEADATSDKLDAFTNFASNCVCASLVNPPIY